MSKVRECDLCHKLIEAGSQRMTLQTVGVEGQGFCIALEVLNSYQLPAPPPIKKGKSSLHIPAALWPIPIARDDDLDLHPECFTKIIQALEAKLTKAHDTD